MAFFRGRLALPLVLFIACLHFGGAAAILPSEIAALTQILAAYPRLSSAMPTNLGIPWPSDLSTVCSQGEGYDAYGVYCSPTGNVIALTVNDIGSWSNPVPGPKPLDLVSGLVFLRNISLMVPMDNYLNLLEALLRTPATKLTGLDLSILPIEVAFQNGCANITEANVIGVSASFDMSNCSSLVKLDVVSTSSPDLIYLTTLPSSVAIQELSVSATSVTSIGAIMLFAPALRSLTLELSQVSTMSFDSLYTFQELKFLRIVVSGSVYPQSISLQLAPLSFPVLERVESQCLGGEIVATQFPATLKSAYFYTSSMNITTDLPASLEALEIEFAPMWMGSNLTLLNPSAFAQCASLTTLSLKSLYSFIGNLPDFSNTRISKFDAYETSLDANMAEQVLCTLPGATLRSITLSRSEHLSILPTCFSTGRFSLTELYLAEMPEPLELNSLLTLAHGASLETLDVSASSFALTQPSEWDAFVEHFPNLKKLYLAWNSLPGTFPMALKQLTQLTSLSLKGNSFVGTVPPLGLLWPRLDSFDLAFNPDLVGALDLSGLPRLVSFSTDYSGITSVPTPSTPGPVNLTRFLHSSSPLQSIPSDAWFARATLLKEFGVLLDPSLALPLPIFWASHPTITSIMLQNSGLTGTIPTVTAPNLQILRLDNNSLTGSFPVFSAYPPRGPRPYLMLNLEDNLLGGTLPKPMLPRTVLPFLSIGRNKFVGPFTDAHMPPFNGNLDISHNSFCGPLALTFTRGYTRQIILDATSFDFCDAPPQNMPSLCSMESLPYPGLCNCLAAYSHCVTDPLPANCSAPLHNTSSSFVAQFCLPSITPCPLPAPQGFSCAPDGTWQIQGETTLPALNIPPSSTSIVVEGNLTVTGGVTFSGTNSHIAVDGCITLKLQKVVIQLTEEEWKALEVSKNGSLPHTLITSLNGNNCTFATDLSLVSISVNALNAGCNRVLASNASPTRSGLVALLSFNSSGCKKTSNLAAIIAPIVSVAVVIIILVAIMLVVKPWNKFEKRLDEMHKAQ